MALVLGDNGSKKVLDSARGDWNTNKLWLHLYVNNYTPVTTSVLADFTEASFAGYAAQQISTWGAASIAAHVAQIVAASNTFTRSTSGATQNVYGYYVMDDTDTVYLWAERDPNAPIPLTNAGDSYTITPTRSEQDLSV